MKKILIILLFMCSLSVFAQKTQADKKFKLYEYSEAIPFYKQYLEQNPNDYDATKKLALSYKYINNISSSIETFQLLLKLKEAKLEDTYDLIQLLRISGNITEARKFAVQYQQKNPGEKAQNLLKAIDMYNEFTSNINEYSVINKTASYNQSVYKADYYK
jgi:tetratricopeptide (TPR) repeat protein